MFAMQADEGIDAVPDNDSKDARVFSVETNFQKMARRPGGILREQALMNAEKELRRAFKQSNRSSSDKLVPVKRPVPDKSVPVKQPVLDKLEPVEPDGSQENAAGGEAAVALVGLVVDGVAA